MTPSTIRLYAENPGERIKVMRLDGGDLEITTQDGTVVATLPASETKLLLEWAASLHAHDQSQ